MPIITTRYPLWEQKDLLRRIDEGHFYLPDAEEGQRETMITGDTRVTAVTRRNE